MQIVHEYTQINYLALRTSDDWQLFEGSEAEGAKLHSLPVLMQDTLYGELRWQSETGGVSLPLMKSVATMLGRGLYFNQAQKHYQQLLLMEERATIARELHDSLAQVLSYLRIQLALLKRTVPDENAQAQTIITDFSRELNNAAHHLPPDAQPRKPARRAAGVSRGIANPDEGEAGSRLSTLIPGPGCAKTGAFAADCA